MSENFHSDFIRNIVQEAESNYALAEFFISFDKKTF